MPKVSVVVPIYKVERYIERCARSLFEQTLDDMEYIFVDDCSPDNSVNVLNTVLHDYPNRKEQTVILHHESNKGLPIARQTGIKAASGEYIAHCDSDDWVDLDLYEAMYNAAKGKKLDVICCDCKNTDGESFTIISGGTKTIVNDCICDIMYRKMWWSLCNKLFRRDIYDHDIMYPNYAMGEDMCLCLQLFKNVTSVGYVSGKYYNYYKNPHSIVNVWTPIKCLNKHEQLTHNLSIVEQCYSEMHNPRIKAGLVYLAFYAQEMLVPAVRSNIKIRRLWKFGLKGLCIPVIFNISVPLKQRIKALLILLNVFPL